MRSLRLYILPVFIMLFLTLSLPALAAEELHKKEQTKFSVALGVEYSTGKYGTSITTDAVSVPLKLYWYPTDRLDFTLELPYLYQSNSTTTPFGMGRFRTGRMQQVGGVQQPMRIGRSNFASTFDVTKSQSGIGDLILKGGYVVYTEEKFIPEIRPGLMGTWQRDSLMELPTMV